MHNSNEQKMNIAEKISNDFKNQLTIAFLHESKISIIVAFVHLNIWLRQSFSALKYF